MPRSSCEPCCNPAENARLKKQYESAHLQILCATLDAILEGGVASSVVVTEVTPGVGATNLGKAEDSPHASGDVGIEVLSRRIDVASSSAGASGDYATLNTDANGKLWTNSEITGALPTGANTIGSIASITTSIVPGTAATNLGKAEDAAHASGDVGIEVLAVRQDVLASSTSATNDYAALKSDAVGAVYTTPGTQAAQFTNAEAGFAALSVAVPTTVLTNTDRLRCAVFSNWTDQTVLWTDGAGDAILRQFPGTQIPYNFADLGRDVRTNIDAQYISLAGLVGGVDVSVMF